MSIELPLLRLGVAGFSAAQQDQVARHLAPASPPHVRWQLVPFAEADAWWLCGPRSQMLPGDVLRVAAGDPKSRALQIHLPEVDRPMAFDRPPLTSQFTDVCRFDLDEPKSVQAVLARFTAWLQPLVAQFGLASCLVDHYGALGGGAFDVELDGRLVAVVDIRGAISVLPTAGPADFPDAVWRRRTATQPVPADFMQTTISHLMWEYALRTQRDLLPAHYRSGTPLYFRRPPRLPQRMLKDAHLLLLRELAASPCSFSQLEQRTGLVGPILARGLAALYYVGAITSNPKRAAASVLQREAADSSPGPHSSVLPSVMDPRMAVRPPPGGAIRPSDLTAPAPLLPR